MYTNLCIQSYLHTQNVYKIVNATHVRTVLLKLLAKIWLQL